MRRAKLAPGSVPAGSLPTVHNQSVPLCFVCDEPIKSHRLSTSLLSGRTQYTHSPLPTKIGGYIGDEFVVVVTPQDTLCKHCTALINTMDRLELELRQHRFQLIQHLKTKYKLDGHCPKPANKVKTVEDKNRIYDTEIVEVSDEEWIPQKRQRTDAIKHHHCTVCNASFTNLNLFMAHLSRHKQSEKMKPATLSVLSTVKSSLSSVSESSQAPHFKCGCCSESFSSKETLAFHMHKHTSLSTKSKTISAAPELVDNSPSKTISSSQNSVLASTVPIFPQFDDAEQSCRQGVLAPNPTGVCSEEQKGRVCLLALLNNGVCSDISHCVGVPTPDSSNIVNAAQKTEEFCDGQTISITVSIPSIVNGGHVSEKRLSVPAILNSSHLSNVSYPVSLGSSSMHSASSLNPPSNECQLVLKDTIVNTDKPLSQGLSSGEHSDASTSCLDMPDLSDDSVQNVAEKNVSNAQNCVEHSEDKADSSKDSSCFWLGNNPIGNLVPESALGLSILPPCRPSHGLDMPSLIDEDLIENDDKNMSIDQISETCGAVAETSGNSVQLNMGPAIEAVRNLQDEANIKFHSVTSSVSKNSSSNSFNSNKNIAIVSVTSVPRNIVGGHYIAGSLSNEWFCSSGMEISTVSAGSNVSKEIALSSSEWVEEDGSFHGKESQSDHNNACEYLTNDFSSVSKTLNVEESKSTVGQGARSKITSLV